MKYNSNSIVGIFGGKNDKSEKQGGRKSYQTSHRDNNMIDKQLEVSLNTKIDKLNEKIENLENLNKNFHEKQIFEQKINEIDLKLASSLEEASHRLDKKLQLFSLKLENQILEQNSHNLQILDPQNPNNQDQQQQQQSNSKNYEVKDIEVEGQKVIKPKTKRIEGQSPRHVITPQNTPQLDLKSSTNFKVSQLEKVTDTLIDQIEDLTGRFWKLDSCSKKLENELEKINSIVEANKSSNSNRNEINLKNSSPIEFEQTGCLSIASEADLHYKKDLKIKVAVSKLKDGLSKVTEELRIIQKSASFKDQIKYKSKQQQLQYQPPFLCFIVY